MKMLFCFAAELAGPRDESQDNGSFPTAGFQDQQAVRSVCKFLLVLPCQSLLDPQCNLYI